MNSHSKLGKGEALYQREPLTTRLKNLLHDYPEGVGIVKELIQNADDAGAKKIHITFDWQTYEAEKLPDPRLKKLMGPAMLIYNDSTFSDQDFQNIQDLGESGKRENLWKTGRFGVGFNSVYHVTDYPSFISRDRIVFFDPHATAVPDTTVSEPGRCWPLSEWWNSSDFLTIYQSGGLKPNTENFNGTLFRLPLRTQDSARDSKIRQQPFEREKNIEPIIRELETIGEELLLFLKSVVEIKVFFIENDGTVQERLSVTTRNQEEVIAVRQKLLDILQYPPEQFLERCRTQPETLPIISYLHTIETGTPHSISESKWRIVSLLRVDEHGNLIRAIEDLAESQEKAVPWAGAAARVSREQITEKDSKTVTENQPVRGRAYCFLPLSQTGLPVHINGFFDLDSSRSKLTSGTNMSGRDENRVNWNKLLVHHVLAEAYANLIVCLVDDVGKEDPNFFYNLWPVGNIQEPALQELKTCVIKRLENEKIISPKLGKHWIEPSKVWTLPSEWQRLREPLSADGIAFPYPPLPKPIHDAFQEADVSIKIIHPQSLRKYYLSMDLNLGIPLCDAPKPSLRKRQWVIDLLCYCLSDDCRNLKGLPLAILADETLQVFGDDCIYYGNENVRKIFSRYPQWFLTSDVTRIKGLTSCRNIQDMDATEVAKKLSDIIVGKPWTFDDDWLALVYQYFATQKTLPQELYYISLVPGNDKKIYSLKHSEVPRWISSQFDSDTREMIRHFSVPLIKASGSLYDAISQFITKHPSAIKLMDAAEVARRLKDVIDPNNPEWNPNSEDVPNAEWLTLVYRYFTKQRSLPKELDTVPIVPGNDGKLHCLINTKTPLWASSQLDPDSLEMMRYFQVPLVDASNSLYDAISRFRVVHDPSIRELTIPDFIDTLYANNISRGRLPYSKKRYDSLLDYLANPQWIQGKGKNDTERHNNLRELSIFPTLNHSLTTLNSTNVYIPDIQPPKTSGKFNLLRLGSSENPENWRSLFNLLKVPFANCSTLILDCLLPSYDEFNKQDKLKILQWIRDHFDIAKTELENQAKNPGILEQKLLNIDLICCIDGKWRSITKVYDPDNQIVREVLGIETVTPDLNYYREGWERWLEFFRSFGLLTSPTAKDLYNRIDELSHQAKKQYTESIAESCVVIFKHIQKNWEHLKNEKISDSGTTLLKALKDKEWLPVEQDEQKLKKYPGYCKPKQKLYRAKDIVPPSYANSVASQRFLFKVSAKLNTKLIALGFEPLKLEEIVYHLDTLIELWEKEKYQNFTNEDFKNALSYIYSILSKKASNSDTDWLKKHYANRNCLWTGKSFWKSSHTFQEKASCFGKYRSQYKSQNREIRDFYEFLGQKKVPELGDYTGFLDELAENSQGNSLNPEDVQCALKVFSKIEKELNVSSNSTANISLLLLTEDNLLLPAEEVLIPDAPWYIEQIRKSDRCKILHQDVSQRLASLVKSPSIGKDVKAEPKGKPQLSQDLEAKELCDRWQTNLKSREFNEGLRRLIQHEHDSSESINLNWLSQVQVLPADEIITDLYLNGDPIAWDIEGDFYFEVQPRTFYLRFSPDDKEVMLNYLAESFNNELKDYKLQDLSKLNSIIGLEPQKIQTRLNSLRISLLHKLSEVDDESEEQENIEDDFVISKVDIDIADDSKNETPDAENDIQNVKTDSQESHSESNLSYSVSKATPETQTERNSSNKQTNNYDDYSHNDIDKKQDSLESSDMNQNNLKESQTTKSDQTTPQSTTVPNNLVAKHSEISTSETAQEHSEIKPQQKSSSRQKSKTKKGRYHTYVSSTRNEQDDFNTDNQSNQIARESIDDAGIARVLEYEKQHGRNPEEKAHTHPGYDVESSSMDSKQTRYIEVKSIRGDWDSRGVKMTHTQFNKARELGDKFWLYVVERAESDTEFKIYMIQDPANRVDEFFYDLGWRKVAKIDEEQGSVPL